MAILKATIAIEGKRPLLFNRFSVEAIPLKKRELTGVAGNDPEEWKRTVLMTKDRQLYIDGSYIFGCLRDGGKHLKSGRGTLQAKVASTLVVLDEIILLDRFVPAEDHLLNDKTEPVYLDIRSVKNPTTRGRNVRYRIAAASGWKADFNIQWDNTVVSRNEMLSVLSSAGDLVGIGDGRGIGCGRFTLVDCKIEEPTEEPKLRKMKVA